MTMCCNSNNNNQYSRVQNKMIQEIYPHTYTRAYNMIRFAFGGPLEMEA